MIKTRGRKILRDILSRKVRTALVATSIAFGVMGAVMLVTDSELMIAKLEEDIKTDDLPMVELDLKLDKKVDEDKIDRDAILDTLRAYPGVTEIQGERHDVVFWRDPDDEGFVRGRIHAYSAPFEEISLESPTLYKGDYPELGHREIVIERRMADEYEFDVGDPLVIRVLSQLPGLTQEVAEIPEEMWVISGIVYNPHIWGVARTSVYAHFDDMAYITGETLYEDVFLRFDDFETAEVEADNLEALVNEQTPYYVEEVDVENPEEAAVIENVSEWADLLTSLSWVAVAVACFLVVSVITTIMVEQRTQIGVLKALGASRGDTFCIYIGLALIYGILGTIPGVLVGIPLGHYVLTETAPLLNVVIDEFMISWKAVVTGAVMGMVMPALVSIIPVFFGTNVTIREALSDFGIAAQFGRSRIARQIARLPLPPAVRHALANVYRKPWRLSLTVLALAMAAGAFMGIFGILISLESKLQDVYETFNYQLSVYPEWQDDPEYETVEALLKNTVDDVDAIYPTRVLDVVVAKKEASVHNEPDETLSVFVEAFDPHTDSIKLHLKEGDAWENNPEREGIVLAKPIAVELGKGVGDIVTVRYDDTEADLEIIGIDNLPYEIAFMSVKTAARLQEETGANAYMLRFENDEMSAAEVDRRAGEIREMLLEHGIMAGFYNQRADVQEQMDVVWRITSLLGILASIMAAVGAVGLLTSLSISVFERQKEIGVMRSVGAKSRTVAQQFLTEGLLVGAIAWLLGVPLGYLIASFLWDMMPHNELEFGYPVATVILGLVGMLVVASIASLWPSLSAARKTVSSILRYQ